MDKNEILGPILTAINDLRGEVRENRREIKKNREKIERNSKSIKSLEERMTSMEKSMTSIEKRMSKHEEESKKDRKAILDILYSYEQVTDRQYKENKERIDKLEKRFQIANA